MRVKLHPLYILFGGIYIIFGQGFIFLCYFIAILIHEFGHAIFAKKLGVFQDDITLYPFGGEVKLNYINLSPIDEVKIALSGPLINLLVASLVLSFNWVFPQAYPYMQYFYNANLFNSLLNLIPAFPLDGGRALFAILKIKLKKQTAIRVCMIMGYITSSIIFVFGVFMILQFNFSYIMLAIFMFIGQMEMRMSGFKSVFLSGGKANMLSQGGLPIKHIMVSEEIIFYRLLSLTQNDYYYIFHIVDSGFIQKAIITESRLYEMSTKNDIYMKIKDII